jgi:hypothetical protein
LGIEVKDILNQPEPVKKESKKKWTM